MKKRFLNICACALMLCTSAFAQDPATTGIVMTPSQISVNQSATVEFDILNGSSSAFNCRNRVIWTLTIPPSLIIDSSSGRVFSFDVPYWNNYVEVVQVVPWNPSDGTALIIQSLPGTGPCAFNPSFVPFPGGNSNGGAMTCFLKVKGKSLTTTGILSLGASSEPAVGTNVNTNDDTYTPYTVTAILPIKLALFEGSLNGCSTVLKWKTLMEEKFSRFEVEYSTDAKNFSLIKTVEAKNNPLGAEYNLTYEQPSAKGYYRLKMIDQDGHFIYSSNVVINKTCGGTKVSLYPNPITDKQSVMVSLSGFSSKITGYLYDVKGKLVLTNTLVNGTNRLNLQMLASDVYWLKIIDNNNHEEALKIAIAH